VLDAHPGAGYLLDADGRIRWLNGAARKLVGECTGQPFLDVIIPQDRARASAAFNDKVLGSKEATELRLEVRSRPWFDTRGDQLGSRPRRIIGRWASSGSPPPGADLLRTPRRAPHLTPRQRETLMLLGEGASTEMIADHLGIARETARNHIRAVLRELGARTRLEAVVEAHARGLL